MISRLSAALANAVPVRAFTTLAVGLAALWFLVIYPILMIAAPGMLPKESRPMRKTYPPDSPQIYLAAIAARYGLWADLYPNYREDALLFPPRFTPRSPLLTGTPENPTGEVDGSIHLYLPQHAIVPPALIEKAPEMKEIFDNGVCKYIQPPPLALLVAPLAFTDIHTWAYVIMPTLASFSFFGMAFFASRIYRELAGSPSIPEGVILLLVIVFSLTGYTHIPQGNLSPVLAFLLALGAYGWIRRWEVVTGGSMILLILSKSLALHWCPLLILREIRWRTLATMAGLTLLINGATLALGGLPAYQRFFSDILPTLDVPGGRGVPGMVWDYFGVYPGTLYRMLIAILCGVIYWGFWRKMGGTPREKRAPVILAALAGTTAIFCSLNFTVWLPYFSCYLFFPFLGWLLWEVTQARGRWRVGLMIGLAACFLCSLGWWLIRDLNVMITGKHKLMFYQYGILNPFYGLVGPAFILLVAFRRLFGTTQTSPLSTEPLLTPSSTL